MPCGLAWGFERANKAGRGCRSKLAWVLLGWHRFGRGSREVHCTWGQTSTSASCAETSPSVPEGFNRTAPGFLRLRGGSSLCSVPAAWQGRFGDLCLGPHAPSTCPSASACWRRKAEVSPWLKVPAWLPSAGRHKLACSWKVKRGTGSFWLAWEHVAFSAWMWMWLCTVSVAH